ncbi:hypothetical protein ACH5RR_017051 [Cinchona calisaya]|uniref:DUF4378 domain-containing protein n=1 Tax=Cinchona calisaya TaxID=153742 RepID=A0ABD2ZXS0_9GENT
MGKEWMFWGGGKYTKKGKSSNISADREGAAAAATTVAPAGCMCAVLQLFDLHHFPFAVHQHHQPSSSFVQNEPTTLHKGLEAPRNSLELEETFVEAAATSSLSSAMKLELEKLNIPMNIQIKTPRVSTPKSARKDDTLSECSSSSPGAGAKTPTLVARLMGLEQLPENSSASPSLSSSSMHSSQGQSQRRDRTLSTNTTRQHYYHLHQSPSCRSFYDNHDISTGTLSLPETPRISLARRSDAEHRLSLQISKENIGEEFDFSAYKAKKLARRISEESKREDENIRRGGQYYARQIVKQVKESSVSRKVGLDITNTIKRRDDHVVLLKPKKASSSKVVKTRIGDDCSQISKQSTPSCSPRFLDPNKNKRVLTKTTDQVSILQDVQTNKKNSAVKKCKKEEYNFRLMRKPPRVSDAIRNKKVEPFVKTSKGNVKDKKCKKTALSNQLLNISVPTLLPVKKDSFFLGTKLLADKQASDAAETWKRRAHISSCSSQSYKQHLQEVTPRLIFEENIQDRCKGSGTSASTSTSIFPGDEAGEYQYYIQRILKRTGIDKSTPVSLAKWYSPSHPLDPSIFHNIELFHPTTSIIPRNSKLNLKCNRRLVFQFVDELLAEILKPNYLNLKQCSQSRCHQMYGSELIETLCSRIKKFPSADCKVLEDIDALVDTDLRSKSSWVPFPYGGEDERERIALEIEREIVESLVHETAMEVAYGHDWLRPSVQ